MAVRKDVEEQKCVNCGHGRMEHYWAVDERIYCRASVGKPEEMESCGCKDLQVSKYGFSSGRKPATKKSSMKNIIIAVLVFTNVLTIVFGLLFVASLNNVFDDERGELINELDKFYFGFCMDAKDSGYGDLSSYSRLCGDQ